MHTADKAALITGAARGIGREIARQLAARGHPVVLLDAHAGVMDAAQALCDEGHAARAVCLDVTDEAAVMELPDALKDLWPSLAIVVNNAGISPKHEGRKREVMDMPLQEWRRVLEVNLTGAFMVTRQCLAPMMRAGWGRVVMVTSQAARVRTPVPGAHYAASKSGLAGLARILAGEVARHGITVNCVAPGRVESDMTAEVGQALNTDLARTIPLGRLGQAGDVAAAVAFFTSAEAGYITGATIDVNGGNTML